MGRQNLDSARQGARTTVKFGLIEDLELRPNLKGSAEVLCDAACGYRSGLDGGRCPDLRSLVLRGWDWIWQPSHHPHHRHAARLSASLAACASRNQDPKLLGRPEINAVKAFQAPQLRSLRVFCADSAEISFITHLARLVALRVARRYLATSVQSSFALSDEEVVMLEEVRAVLPWMHDLADADL